MEAVATTAQVVASPANDNGPILELWPVGDGRVFVQTLARILVRRELISLGVISDPDRCETEPTPG